MAEVVTTAFSIGDTFSTYFTVSAGTDAASIECAQRLRYDVYCREFGYEREEDCPGGREVDVYDAQADHCLIRHQASGEIAGCLRLVRAGAIAELPIQRHAAAALVGASTHPGSVPASERCEISRIAVSAGFRRRPAERESPLGANGPAADELPGARSFPLLAMALFMAARLMVLHRDTPHVFAMMEPRLARMLARAGLDFQRLGPVIEYHGPRAAYYLHYSRQAHEVSIRSLRPDLLDLFRAVESQLAPQLASSGVFAGP